MKSKGLNYEEQYHGCIHKALHGDFYYEQRALISSRKYLKNIPKSARILEVGCGLGQNIYLFKNAVGYDISQYSRDFCRKKGVQVIASLEEAVDGSFDAVLFCHSLEHVPNPYELIHAIYPKLKLEGKLLVVLPFERHGQPANWV